MARGFAEVSRLPQRELRALWRSGKLPPAESLEGMVFRGQNTSWTARLGPGGGAFAKGFVRTGPELHGCNFPVSVHGGEWRVDVLRPFGFFRVEPAHHPRGEHPATALLLDYGSGGADRFRERGAPRPSLPLRLVEIAARPLRDFLVQPPDCSPSLLLGRAYYTGRPGVPVTFFVLEAWQPLTAPWAVAGAPARWPGRRVS